MPRPLSIASGARREDSDHSVVSLSRSPTVKRAKARLSRLLHRKSFELQDYSQTYDFRDHGRKSKTVNRQTMAAQPVGGGIQDIRWQRLQQIEHGPHKLSMVSEREEPLTPSYPRPASRAKKAFEPARPEPRQQNVAETRPGSAKSSVSKTIAGSSKHDSMLTDYSELCAMPNEEDEQHRELRDSLRQIHELPSTGFTTRHSRTPSCSAPIPCSISDEATESSASSQYAESTSDIAPVSPIAPQSPVPQVTAMDVAKLPDFSFVPNAVRRRSDALVTGFQDNSNVVTDWQVECFRLRKQLKAVELQLRYKAELLASEQSRIKAAELEVERTKTELQLVRGETQLLRVSNGLKHDETCALKAELGSLQSSDQTKHKELLSKLRSMAERLTLEEDAVADKDLRIKWLEKEREELERENRVLENVKGALWGHMEQARKREAPVSPTVAESQSCWI